MKSHLSGWCRQAPPAASKNPDPTVPGQGPAGTGDVFLEDTIGKAILVNFPQRFWARQLNTEGITWPNLVENHGGLMWILGQKTEGGVTAIQTVGGVTELLGALAYPSQGVATNVPLYVGYTDTLILAGLGQDALGQWRFEVQARPWLRYAVEASSDLRNWEALGTNTATAAPCMFTDTNTPAPSTRFYRAKPIEP